MKRIPLRAKQIRLREHYRKLGRMQLYSYVVLFNRPVMRYEQSEDDIVEVRTIFVPRPLKVFN